MVTHTLEPIINRDAKILILGSFPSVKSREQSFYYMHPTNRFWDVLAAIYHENFRKMNNMEKKACLLKHHVALYDVVKQCQIQGSSDASLEVVRVHNIADLLQGTAVRYIILNGRKAEVLFKRYFPELVEMALYKPSTSVANAMYRLDDLVDEWKEIGVLSKEITSEC